jgi:hypothetical protein
VSGYLIRSEREFGRVENWAEKKKKQRKIYETALLTDIFPLAQMMGRR